MSIGDVMTLDGLEIADRVARGGGTPKDVCELAGLCAIMSRGHNNHEMLDHNWRNRNRTDRVEWRALLDDCSRLVRIRKDAKRNER
mgnify:CR=1 FL=1